MSSEVSVSAPDDDDDVPVGLGERLRRIVAVPGRLLGSLFLPDKYVPQQVNAQHYGAALLAIIFCGLVGQAAIGARLDVSTDILQQASQGMGGPGGPGGGGGGGGGGRASGSNQGAQAAAVKSDREIQEDITKSLAVERVTRALGAGLWTPLKILLLTLFIYLVLRYAGGKPTLTRAFSATTHAALPYAAKALIIAVAAYSQASLTPAQADSMVANPLAPTFATLGNVGIVLSIVDPFMLWSVGLLVLGAAPAAEISRKRAFVTILVAFVLFLGVSNFFAHMGGGGGGGPQMEGN
jgi:hypothetical protein